MGIESKEPCWENIKNEINHKIDLLMMIWDALGSYEDPDMARKDLIFPVLFHLFEFSRCISEEDVFKDKLQ